MCEWLQTERKVEGIRQASDYTGRGAGGSTGPYVLEMFCDAGLAKNDVP